MSHRHHHQQPQQPQGPHHPPREIFRRAIRREICAICDRQPTACKGQGPECVRPCEGSCAIFVNLPTLRRIIRQVHTPAQAVTQTGYERAIKNLICQRCELSATAGDYCANRSEATCPLARYEVRVIDVFERVERALSRDQARQH